MYSTIPCSHCRDPFFLLQGFTLKTLYFLVQDCSVGKLTQPVYIKTESLISNIMSLGTRMPNIFDFIRKRLLWTFWSLYDNLFQIAPIEIHHEYFWPSNLIQIRYHGETTCTWIGLYSRYLDTIGCPNWILAHAYRTSNK